MSTDKKRRLGDDPFANKSLGGLDMLIGSTTDGARDLNVKETPSKPKRGRPTEIKRDITKTSQSGLREGLTRATFIIREDTLDKLKERAYTDRKKLKDLVTEALDYYLDNHKVKQPKQTFKRKDDMKYRQIKQYAGVAILSIGFIYAGLELVDRQPVQSVGVGILAFLLVETALQNKSK